MIKDLVSVIIPTYKRPDQLSSAINSVLSQDYKDIEIIVIDNNNLNDEYQIKTILLMNQHTNDSRIKYLINSHVHNGSAARNLGILESKGEFISFLDDDDYFLPNKISSQVNLLKTYDKSYGAICCNYIGVYKNRIYRIGKNSGEITSYIPILTGKLKLGAGSTLLIRREVINLIGLFDETFSRHQDWEFLIRFFDENKLIISPVIGTVIRADSIINRHKTDILIDSKKKLFYKYREKISSLDINTNLSIKLYQNTEIFVTYILERKYSKAIFFAISNRCDVLKYIPRILSSVLISLFPKISHYFHYLMSIRYKSITIISNNERIINVKL
jgi:glycosyltransferase involved in cell wall biosynthesis